MPWFDPLVGEPFIKWLREAASSRYAPEEAADPFATSMRDFDDVTADLVTIQQGGTISPQRGTDLRGAKIAVSSSQLSPLGVGVLAAWQNYQIDNNDYQYELPRQLCLICEALICREPFYVGIEEFWSDKVNRYGLDPLLDNLPAMYMLTAFAKRLGDFSPLDHVAKFDTSLPDWDPAALQAKITALAGAGDPALTGLDRVARSIEQSASRGKARKIFMIALDLACDPSRAAADEKLSRWTIPMASTARSHTAIPDNVKDLCLRILDDYRDRLSANHGKFPAYLDVLLARKNVVMFGPPGTGKTFAAQAIAEFWKGRHGSASVVTVTFHPSYSYEDFVWGWRPDRDSVTNKFVPQLGALLEACKTAAEGCPTLLLIDEINRADTAKVFGELITFIEADKRGINFRLAQDPTVERNIPDNLYLLGTMNTADRSVSLLDVALRRRFAFVEFVPDGEVFGPSSGWANSIDGIRVASIMNEINARLLNVGVEPDRAIGHALFGVSESGDPIKQLRERFQFDIHPLIVDYCFSDRSRVAEVLGPLVSSTGRMNDFDDTQFIAALRSLVKAPVEEPPVESVGLVTPGGPAESEK
ncbi:McrB family protein [Caballeronia sp. INML2]|uniref:McrB family protein n=1 Tax=Caballeronia sp. INML2 TaxID=2921748 RepID=UPI002027764D|nr:AAA family ATPase [Caballeronia sp. INML2]